MAIAVCHEFKASQIEHGDAMSSLSDDVLARLRSLDLVGFVVSPADPAPEIAQGGIAKNGVMKAGIQKVGIQKLGVARTR